MPKFRAMTASPGLGVRLKTPYGVETAPALSGVREGGPIGEHRVVVDVAARRDVERQLRGPGDERVDGEIRARQIERTAKRRAMARHGSNAPLRCEIG